MGRASSGHETTPNGLVEASDNVLVNVAPPGRSTASFALLIKGTLMPADYFDRIFVARSSSLCADAGDVVPTLSAAAAARAVTRRAATRMLQTMQDPPWTRRPE
jgi:hypothetical protein